MVGEMGKGGSRERRVYMQRRMREHDAKYKEQFEDAKNECARGASKADNQECGKIK